MNGQQQSEINWAQLIMLVLQGITLGLLLVIIWPDPPPPPDPDEICLNVDQITSDEGPHIHVGDGICIREVATDEYVLTPGADLNWTSEDGTVPIPLVSEGTDSSRHHDFRALIVDPDASSPHPTGTSHRLELHVYNGPNGKEASLRMFPDVSETHGYLHGGSAHFGN